MSLIGTTAEAVATAITDSGVTASFSYFPALKSKSDLASLKVYVIPSGQAFSLADRSKEDTKTVMLDVLFIQKLSEDSDTGALLDTVENVYESLRYGTFNGMIITQVEQDPLYDMDSLKQNKQFESVLKLTLWKVE